MGTGFELNLTPDQEGMIPRALRQLFTGIEKRRSQASATDQMKPDFFVSVQFMEIYNESVMDLFEPSAEKRIRIHEDPAGGIVCDGLVSVDATSFEGTMHLLQKGALNRTTASTNMNTQSSRSHAVFTLIIKQTRSVKNSNDDESVKEVSVDVQTVSSKFHFVDLAGSERLKRTGATGDRAKEGISINQGLLALGNVISALGDVAKKNSHVPYRDSKITRLLQDSLGGNSRTIMIACVSPSDSDFMETLNTLKYANRARNIKNKITQNQDSSSKQLALLRTKLSQALAELALYKSNGAACNAAGDQGKSSADVTAYNDMFQENYMLQEEVKRVKNKLKELQDIIERQKARLVALQMENVDSSDIESKDIIQNYLTEIEDLKNRLAQAEVRNARPRIGSAREISTLTSQNPRELIERAKYEIELNRSGLMSNSDEPSPRDSHDDEDGDDDVMDSDHVDDDENDDTIQKYTLEAQLRTDELNDIR